MKIELKRNPVKGRCQVKFCNKKTKGKMCSTHRSQKCRANDPVRYAFYNLKASAKRRNIVFTITIEQFRDWCRKVKYIGFAGRSSTSFTIDRIHNDIGYHIDNINVMQKGDNVKKYFYYDYRTRVARYERGEVIEGPF
jgi:hypothetical protein